MTKTKALKELLSNMRSAAEYLIDQCAESEYHEENAKDALGRMKRDANDLRV